jgi:hypothetical protein
MQNLFKNLVCASVLCLAIQVAPAAEVTHFTVAINLLAPEPINPRLYGNFIELGYGVQVEPMWCEMFSTAASSRSSLTRTSTLNGLIYGTTRKITPRVTRPTRSHEDWYHTGYEHNPWFAAPGDDGLLPIDHQSTFIVEKTPLAKVEVRPVPGGSGHGVQSLIVSNHDPEKWGGLGQVGKLLRPVASYTFRGKFRSLKSPVNAEIRFYPHGHWDAPIARLPLAEIGTNWDERSVSFTNQSFAGWAGFALWLPPGAEVQVDVGPHFELVRWP